MTNETKAEKEVTIEDKLKALYHLQQVVSDIDKIRVLRGELPLEVRDLEDELFGLQTRLDNYAADITEQEANISAMRVKIEEAKIKIGKYKEQQENVRNSREYDNLSKEIEYQTLDIELCEKRIREYTAALEQKQADKAQTITTMEERRLDLNQKKSELDEIVAETKQEEENLREKAKQIEGTVGDERLLNAFKRIRKNARNGLAVVTVERGACGGCFNKIPAQRQLDIRSRKKVIVCEYCGRILVDPELGGDDKQEEA